MNFMQDDHSCDRGAFVKENQSSWIKDHLPRSECYRRKTQCCVFECFMNHHLARRKWSYVQRRQWVISWSRLDVVWRIYIIDILISFAKYCENIINVGRGLAAPLSRYRRRSRSGPRCRRWSGGLGPRRVLRGCLGVGTLRVARGSRGLGSLRVMPRLSVGAVISARSRMERDRVIGPQRGKEGCWQEHWCPSVCLLHWPFIFAFISQSLLNMNSNHGEIAS